MIGKSCLIEVDGWDMWSVWFWSGQASYCIQVIRLPYIGELAEIYRSPE